MHRESVYVCTYTVGEDQHVAHVRAWDGHEAAELFAREIEMECDGCEVRVADIRVRPVFRGDRADGTIAA